jgi:hypothetical protein
MTVLQTLHDNWRAELQEISYEEMKSEWRARADARKATNRPNSHKVASRTELTEISYEELMSQAQARDARRSSVGASMVQLGSAVATQPIALSYVIQTAFDLLWGTVKTLGYATKYILTYITEKVLLLGFLDDLVTRIRVMSRNPNYYMFFPRLFNSFRLGLGREFGEIGTGKPFFRLCAAFGFPFGMSPNMFARQVTKVVKPSIYMGVGFGAKWLAQELKKKGFKA